MYPPPHITAVRESLICIAFALAMLIVELQSTGICLRTGMNVKE